jgi:heme-degrading monooxygenase HmoA
MISRVWHGWTKRENADGYAKLLREEILPGIHRVRGFKGAQVLRRETGDEIEFVTITLFDSLADVKEFAGPDYEKAVITAEARKLLSHFDAKSAHYETVFRLE